ncbi:MAG: Rrf2 family transcriptional regulator [Bacteroidales bacterium]|nr:Rrf2 family transcriptional regulator [Bacteroidales bacterium]
MARIFSLSEAASIAIHSMILIAKSDQMVNVLQISEVTGSSKHHVAKVLQRLVKDGYLNSTRGPSGGFTLKRDASEINLLQIYEAIEGKIEVTDCPMDNDICPFNKCLMGGVIGKMTKSFREYLESNSIESFLE